MKILTQKLFVLLFAISLVLADTDKEDYHSDCELDEKETPSSIVLAKHHNISDYPSLAKVSILEAIQIISKSTGGKIVEIELEADDGHLVYEALTIGNDGSVWEIEIDPGTGTILEKKRQKDGNNDSHKDDME